MLTGQPLPRLEDHRFLTGQARYIADIPSPQAAHMAVLRSPHAHAHLGPIDTTAARNAPGTLGVYTATNLAALGPIPCGTNIPNLITPPRTALATTRVRHVGEPVAVIIAETPHQATDAAELIQPDYTPLPPVIEATEALAPNAPQLWPEAPNNHAFHFQKGNPQATAQAFATAPHIVDLHLTNNRVIVAPIEHRGALATHDPSTNTFTLLLSGQGVHAIRNDLAQILHIPPETLHVACPDVGGGFGAKNGVYPEYICALWAARHLNRPIRWQGAHTDDFLSTAHGRDNQTHARLALEADGRFLALEVHTVANLGAALATGGPGSSTIAPGNAMGAGYHIPNIHMSVQGAFTNTVPLDAYRGAGKPEANYIIERLIDAAATQLNRDRTQLRQQNLVHQFPHRTAIDTTIDGGRFAENIPPALQAANASTFPARRAAAAPLLLGLGITCFLETARGAPGEGAELRFTPNGRVSLALGTQSNGQGHETAFPQIAADRLGLPIETFDYHQADTRTVRNGNGHGGARSLHMGGTALVAAIDAALAAARPIAARLLQADPAELTYSNGTFQAPGRTITLPELARAAPGALDNHQWTPLDLITFPNGTHIAEIALDPETGAIHLRRYTAVDDFGTVINPLLLRGQVQGGLAQGIGQALMERVVHDPQSGQLLTGSFMDYPIPRAADLPDLDIHVQGTPTTANPLGVKGAGQAGAIAAPPAIVAAVLDALAPLGITHIDMPLTPERVWQAIQSRTPLLPLPPAGEGRGEGVGPAETGLDHESNTNA